MKTSFFFLLLLWSLSACHSDVNKKIPAPIADSSPTAPTTPVPKAITRPEIKEEALQKASRAFQEQYGSQYDHIAYSLQIDTAYYFVVVNGNWSLKLQEEKQEQSTYQMGLVNAQNDVLLPIKFDKIYNMGATAPNLFEVEWQGKHGLYNHQGVVLLKEEYDALYPSTQDSTIWAYWRKGQEWGALYGDGSTAPLEQQPQDLVKSWAFDSQKASLLPFIKTSALIEKDHSSTGKGVLVYPSYLYDLNIAPAYDYHWTYAANNLGMDKTKASVEPLANSRTTALLTSFEQAFLEARDYHEEKQAVITVDEQYQPVDSILIQTLEQLPVCGIPAQVRLIGVDTIEVAQVQSTPQNNYAFQTVRRYYHLQKEGQLQALPRQGYFAASQYVPLTAAALKGCFARTLTEEDRKKLPSEGYFSFEVTRHLSLAHLQYMRNEIYARHGYKFKSKEWQEVFEKEPWYKAQSEQVDSLLSPIEQYNVQFLLDYEKKMMQNEWEMLNVSYESGNYAG